MEIIEKPWGKELIIEVNDNYVVKKLFMKKDCRCSLQYHEKKHETVYVLSGKVKLVLNDSFEILEEGDHYVIPPNTIHRMEGVEDSWYLEASTPDLDDVMRVEDDYGRN